MHWIARKTLVKNFLAIEFPKRFLSTFNLKNNQSNLINVLNNIENSICENKNKFLFEKLLIKFSKEWPFEQSICDLKLDDDQYAWSDNVKFIYKKIK